MSDTAIHRLYRHFRELPVSMRALFTGTLLILGLGYLFAILYVFAAHAGADGKPGLSVDDIKITYSGSAETTVLEKALRGAMSGMLPPKDMATMLEWIHNGADKKSYTAQIQSIVADNCLSCHDGSNPHLVNLDGWDNLSQVVARNTGTDLNTLVRLSHIHMFGMTFIFFIIGFIFSHAYLRPIWLKVVLIFAPFAGIAADVLGWYVTKVFPPWAWVVMIAGAVNGLAFATMWVISMYQMWIYKLPPQLQGRHLPDVDG
ncbi:MAG: hypothetical protein PVG42_09350 [Lysobacterales bacterium]|jgi:hypothetical protein